MAQRGPGERPIWFEATSYGYGSGRPVAWQGWAVLVAFVILFLAAGLLASRSLLAYLSVAAVLIAGLLIICSRTTRGGWRWRWGEKE